jgi:fatty-acyl-CoA synthase
MAGSGASLTYAELDDRSARLADWFAGAGLGTGDTVVLALPNDLRWPEVVWSALRSGLYLAPVDWHLGSRELSLLLDDAQPQAVVTSRDLLPTVRAAADEAGALPVFLVVDDEAARADGWPDRVVRYDDAINATRRDDRRRDVAGARLLFSSGTTGRPKPFRQSLPGCHPADLTPRLGPLLSLLDFDDADPEDDAGLVFLSTGPCYHAAPFAFLQTVQQLGGTVVIMERFDAAAALRAIERFAVTHSQWVPTMLVRLLRLEERERTGYDLSSHRVAVHSGAPCDTAVKQAVLRWWGPIVYEYYGASEGHGHTVIGPQEWLEHPGSVGRPVRGRVEIRDESGKVLPAHSPGHVWFVTGQSEGTVGDLGYLDVDGFLYLTGRASQTIISGGVNVYPREVEQVLATHPSVADVAILGVPDEEFGERVKAVVQLEQGHAPSGGLAEELINYCRQQLAHVKCPRLVDFTGSLPRNEAGKVNLTELRQRHAQPTTARSAV